MKQHVVMLLFLVNIQLGAATTAALVTTFIYESSTSIPGVQNSADIDTAPELAISPSGDTVVFAIPHLNGGTGELFSFELETPLSDPLDSTSTTTLPSSQPSQPPHKRILMQQRLPDLADETGAAVHFGGALAMTETTLAVGAPLGNNYSGAVFVFTRDNPDVNWTLVASLTAPNRLCRLGTAVAVGETILVAGCPSHVPAGVYLWERPIGTSTWNGPVKLPLTDFLPDAFGAGTSVALSLDNENNIAAGDPYHDIDGGVGDGAIWIVSLTSDGITWGEEIRVTGSMLQTKGLGASLSFNAAGTLLAIGAIHDSPYDQFSDMGATFLLTRDEYGNWLPQATIKLVGSGAMHGASQGWKVALNGDGTVLVTSGWMDVIDTSTQSPPSKGALWVFTKNSTTGLWLQVGQKITRPEKEGYGLGLALAMATNTSRVVAAGMQSIWTSFAKIETSIDNIPNLYTTYPTMVPTIGIRHGNTKVPVSSGDPITVLLGAVFGAILGVTFLVAIVILRARRRHHNNHDAAMSPLSDGTTAQVNNNNHVDNDVIIARMMAGMQSTARRPSTTATTVTTTSELHLGGGFTDVQIV